MSRVLEKIIIYVLGAVAGCVVALVCLSLLPLSLSHDTVMVVIAFTALIGVFVAITFVEESERKIMERSIAVRNEATALITHEMRTGLTSTGWAIEAILKDYHGVLSPADTKLLEDVIKSIHTTVMHSVNLLDVSLLGIGKISIALAWLPLADVKEMAEEMIERYSVGAKKIGANLISHIHLDAETEVEVDMLRLRIILENLLENSLQYVAGDKKEITVTVENNKTTLTFSVKDTGIGIPLAEQPKIFSEFYRASNARKKLSSGSGIGLYMCQQYVKAHRGQIRFETKENEGTTFFVTIPLKTAQDTNEFLAKV